MTRTKGLGVTRTKDGSVIVSRRKMPIARVEFSEEGAKIAATGNIKPLEPWEALALALAAAKDEK